MKEQFYVYRNVTSYSVLNFSATFSTFISFLEYLFTILKDFTKSLVYPLVLLIKLSIWLNSLETKDENKYSFTGNVQSNNLCDSKIIVIVHASLINT